MTTFAELEQKRQAGGLTPAEKKQWEILFNQDEYAVEQIFRTPVGGKVAIPNEANRRIIWQWAQGEIEPITDIRVWFANIFRENPSLARQLAWQDAKALDPAYQAELAMKNEKELRARFLEVCKAQGIANSDANFSLWAQSGPDPVVSWFNGPCIVLESGDTLELTPATESQKDQWAEDLRKKAFQTNQDNLREMAAKGDIQGLRKAAAEETVQKQLTSFEQRRNYSLLKNFITRGEKDREPLPTHYRGQPLTADTIKKGGKEVIVDLGKRCGFERLNCLLHGIQDIEKFFSSPEHKLKALEAEFGERSFTF